MIDFENKLIEWGVKAGMPIHTAPEQIRNDLMRLVKIAYEAGIADSKPRELDCDGSNHASGH